MKMVIRKEKNKKRNNNNNRKIAYDNLLFDISPTLNHSTTNPAQIIYFSFRDFV